MVRVGPLVNLDKLVRTLGHDPGPVFKELGIDPETYTNPDNLIAYVRSSALLNRFSELTDCGHFCLLLGQMASPSHLGLPGFLAKSAPTVEAALVSLVEYLDLHDEGGTVSLDIGPEFSSLSYSIHLDGVLAVEQINDLAAVMICKLLSFLCGPDWSPISVKLERREPADRTAWRRYFRSAIYFDATECEVVFGNQCLQKEPPTADALLFRHLEQEARLMHDLHRGNLVDSLPGVLRRSLLDGRFSAPEIAESFGLHERTLHRRLKEAGTSFRQELDQVRRVLSEQLLENTDMAVSDIATTLGYADASGFIRAFERWCGISPNAWRKENAEL